MALHDFPRHYISLSHQLISLASSFFVSYLMTLTTGFDTIMALVDLPETNSEFAPENGWLEY